ncbi:DUF2514 domain-containing protein [Pseudomonas fluorescens]|uniref:DUF2514 domain-containing protein n=1 Tax=Pseudomonas fluorescens TaxID=294 RepID=UPI0002F6366F|nr:DUF2514 domain-containing protein [Pseudomonas fluorescens]
MTVYLKAGAILLLITLACGALFGAYHHGETLANAEWQDRWDKAVAQQQKDKAAAESAARVEEQRRQHATDEVAIHATQALEQARTDAATANTAAGRLRESAAKLVTAASSCSGNSGTATAGTPATNPGNLLAVVLDKSVQRNRELAEIADTARVNGLACEAAYDALVKRE